MGKGRTIAATMKEHFVAGQGSRALWVSVSKDLCYDAQRDLDDVKCDVRVFPQVNTCPIQYPDIFTSPYKGLINPARAEYRA